MCRYVSIGDRLPSLSCSPEVSSPWSLTNLFEAIGEDRDCPIDAGVCASPHTKKYALDTQGKSGCHERWIATQSRP